MTKSPNIPSNRDGLHADIRQSDLDGRPLDAALASLDWSERVARFWRHFVAVDGEDLIAAIEDGADVMVIGGRVTQAWAKFGKPE